MFVDKYIGALHGDLREDEHHHATTVLRASAFADPAARHIGALIARVKYADGPLHMKFEGNAANLESLFRAWLEIVTSKGMDRKWLKDVDLLTLGPGLFRRVTEQSLAHFLNGMCAVCNGTGAKTAKEMFRKCDACEGTRRAKLVGMGGYEAKLTADMICELEALESTHAGLANTLLRKD